MEDLAESLIQKPDTMSETLFAKLKARIEPKMVRALLLQNENTHCLLVCLLSLSELKMTVHEMQVQRSFKWDGKTFKES